MRYWLTIFISLAMLKVHSQDRKMYQKDSIKIHQSPIKIVDLNPGAVDSNSKVKELWFNSFLVKDVRADTSTIGLQVRTTSLTSSNYYRKLKFDKPASQAIADYLNSYLITKPSSNQDAIAIFIKALRVAQIDSLNATTNNKELYNRINFEAEAYVVNNDKYYPAFKIDTVVTSLTYEKDSFSVVNQTLSILVKKATLLDTMKIFSRRFYTLTEIDSKYKQRFDKPILTATKLTAGIYKSFSEFVNNNPSIKNYEIKTDKKLTSLYEKGDKNDLTIESKAFGFCDGSTVWINVENVFHPLIRQENTFEFLGNYYDAEYKAGANYTNVTVTNSAPLSMGLSTLVNVANGMSYTAMRGKIVHQLNMETGTFY